MTQKWLLLSESDCGEGVTEEEYNKWYDEIHAPDALELPGIIRVTRYVDIEPTGANGKYLALYEIEADDIKAVQQAIIDSRERIIAEKRITPVGDEKFKEVIPTAPARWYKQISLTEK